MIVDKKISRPTLNSDLFGYNQIEKLLWDNFKNNKLHHAMLFSGNYGIGKTSFAIKLAKMIILESSKNKESDLLKIDSGSHPDLLLIKREMDQKHESKRDITVEMIKKIKDFINVTSAISRYRVIVIDSVDELNRNSGNALLKSLEEPNDNIFFFLINHNLNNLSSTIKSRCYTIKIKPLNYNDWKLAVIENLGPIQENYLQNLFLISDGSVSLGVETYLNHGLEFYSELTKTLAGNDYQTESNKFVEKLSEKNFPLTIFERLISFYLNRLIKILSNIEIGCYISEYESAAIELFTIKNSLGQALELEERITKILMENRKFNLDRKQTLFNIFSIIHDRL